MSRKIIFLTIFSCLMILFTGCSRILHTDRLSVENDDESDGIRITLWSQHGQYKPGESIEVKATIENNSDHVIVLENPNGMAFDLCCYENGDTWAANNPDQATDHIELAPEEKIVIELSFIPSERGMHSFNASVSVLTLGGGRSEFGVNLGVIYAFDYE